MNIRRRPMRYRQALFVIFFAGFLCGCQGSNSTASVSTGAPPPPKAHSYSTMFPLTENPISESGNWLGGADAGGNLWGNVRTAPGLAYGASEPTLYGDPTAILTGTWGPAQTVTATVKIVTTPANACCHEVELRLRATIANGNITGYEVNCSVMPSYPYCHVFRWNGPNGSFKSLDSGTNSLYVVEGDVIEATVTGTDPTVITLYKNGAQVLQASDTGAAGGGFGAFGPWSSGNPGIGFYDQADSNWNTFGFSSFSATDAAPSGAVQASIAGRPAAQH